MKTTTTILGGYSADKLEMAKQDARAAVARGEQGVRIRRDGAGYVVQCERTGVTLRRGLRSLVDVVDDLNRSCWDE